MNRPTRSHSRVILSGMFLVVFLAVGGFEIRAAAGEDGHWKRNSIDASSKGADGVRLADADGDGRLDIVTGWEQGGRTRVYLNPGHRSVRDPWPAVTVGRTPDVEDAVLVDLDADGMVDVLSACEGATRALFVHWAPHSPDSYLEPAAWRQELFPAAANAMRWMFILPFQIDGEYGVDFVAGGRGEAAALGWFASPPNPRRPADWRWYPLRTIGWLMSLEAHDMNGDGRSDIVFTDRTGQRAGAFWLEKPGSRADLARPWLEHPIGGLGQEVMFLALADLDHDGLTDVLVATKPRHILFLRRLEHSGLSWKSYSISTPEHAGTPKAVNVADIDLDGRFDIVVTCEEADSAKSGVFWLSSEEPLQERSWKFHDISGPEGTKFDLVQLLDLDGDGDQDVITCEENENLGVFWYENPARSPEPPGNVR